MKKFTICLITTCLLLTFYPLQSNIATPVASASLVALKPEKSAKVKAKALEIRLNEINAMDKSSMKSSEKKSLRKEVRSIRQQLKELSGGIYFSAGAIIIILLLILILL